MREFTYVIKDEIGIHGRPAGKLVEQAAAFSCSCTIFKGDSSADMKRLFKLMKLSVRTGDEVRVVCEGEDEAEAAAVLEQYLQENL